MTDNIISKRNGNTEQFSFTKILNAVNESFKDMKYEKTPEDFLSKLERTDFERLGSVEKIQDKVEKLLLSSKYKDVAKNYIIYRFEHEQIRSLEDRIDYMDDYASSKDNASSASETDGNANVTQKNVASLDAEVYKVNNRKIQRWRMYNQLKYMYDENLANQYFRDLENHVIYVHDEASSAVPKNYCEAVSLYPLVVSGTKTMDGLNSNAPQNLSSFCGQLTNLTFLLSSQCKGAVAFSEFFNFFDYFCVKDFGEDYVKNASTIIDNPDLIKNPKTVLDRIHQAYQQIIYSWNQPAGNRAYQSPFTNISYFDSGYWHSMFDDFCFPDGTKPEWERIDFLQRDFMNWFNNERLKTLLTFPVETMALLTDNKDVIDKDYKKLTADMWSKGHSFFCYLSDNADSLASCCRLKNEIGDNEFSFTNGLTGVMTGSCNVITLNLNRITQDYMKTTAEFGDKEFKKYLSDIVNRIHKYHIAYKTILYNYENHDMLTASKAGYITMDKLFSTVGLNGVNEAAEYLGMKCQWNDERYKGFCHLITTTIGDLNKLNGTDKFKFNTEFVPAESLGAKNYNWDKADGYWVPKDGNHLYNSYFYKADDVSTTVLDRFKLHGRDFVDTLDGGVGLHCNLDNHLSSEQYSKLIDIAIEEGTNYFTFNIPNCSCDDCGFIAKKHFNTCPKCGSKEVTDWTRVIGYLRPVKSFEKPRQYEAGRRVYSKFNQKNI